MRICSCGFNESTSSSNHNGWQCEEISRLRKLAIEYGAPISVKFVVCRECGTELDANAVADECDMCEPCYEAYQLVETEEGKAFSY